MGRTGSHTFEPARGFWLWILDRAGFDGITLPWRTIYLRPAYIDDHQLRAHELAHIRQIDRDGAWLWSVKIVYYVLRYGYTSSPYEIEARAEEARRRLGLTDQT